jgi:hypothetical protein
LNAPQVAQANSPQVALQKNKKILEDIIGRLNGMVQIIHSKNEKLSKIKKYLNSEEEKSKKLSLISLIIEIDNNMKIIQDNEGVTNERYIELIDLAKKTYTDCIEANNIFVSMRYAHDDLGDSRNGDSFQPFNFEPAVRVKQLTFNAGDIVSLIEEYSINHTTYEKGKRGQIVRSAKGAPGYNVRFDDNLSELVYVRKDNLQLVSKANSPARRAKTPISNAFAGFFGSRPITHRPEINLPIPKPAKTTLRQQYNLNGTVNRRPAKPTNARTIRGRKFRFYNTATKY